MARRPSGTLRTSRSQLELAVLEYVAWFTNTRCAKRSTIGHPEKSRNSTLRKDSQRERSAETRKPTTTVIYHSLRGTEDGSVGETGLQPATAWRQPEEPIGLH
jgi:hypothetical protein